MAHYFQSTTLQKMAAKVRSILSSFILNFNQLHCRRRSTPSCSPCSLIPTKFHTNFHSTALQKKIDADMLALQQQVEDAQRLQVTSRVELRLKFFEIAY